MDIRLNHIAGCWQPAASGATREVRDPADRRVIGLVADSDAADEQEGDESDEEVVRDVGGHQASSSLR